MGSKENSAKPSQPVIHEFGEEKPSDVTLIVGGEHFKCHKMFLAARSSYFKTMFSSDIKEEDQKRMALCNEDPFIFKLLMSVVYGGRLVATTKCKVALFWKHTTQLTQMADRFDLLRLVVMYLELFFFRATGWCEEHKNDCPFDGLALLVATIHNMEEFKAKSTASKIAVSSALDEIHSVQPNLEIDVKKLSWLMKRE